MKKLLVTTAVMFVTAIASSQAIAELTLISENQTFTYEPNDAAGADNFIVGGVNNTGLGGDNGLNDMAIYLGYRNSGGVNETPIRLTAVSSQTGGSTLPGTIDNRGSITFDTVTFGNGVTVDAVATFRLTDSTNVAPEPGQASASLLYDLELTTNNVPANPGALQSIVGFDFNDTNGNDRNQGAEIISGFGQGNVAVGEVNAISDRILSGNFIFANQQDNGRTIDPNNQRTEQFNGLIADNLVRFQDAPTPFVSANGDTGFLAYSDFQEVSDNDLYTTAGAIGFRSAITANVVPEPSTLLMASMGLGMVAFRRRRKQA